jgi:3'(2'), 5'-bisphosphate nucleotidase
MDVYATDFEVRRKDDRSPVSDADERAEALLIPGTRDLLPGVPIVAEESVSADGIPDVASEFVLIDPLDGTREFVGRRGDFTVNVALVRHGLPVVGVVYAPARERMFVAGSTATSGTVTPGEQVGELQRICTREYPSEGLVAVASRSHLDVETREFLQDIKPVDTRTAGSSLKFCLVAAGEADVYPRFGPTMEWDTAAGHAVLVAAGGSVVHPEGAPFRYGKPGLRNGAFIAWGRRPLR